MWSSVLSIADIFIPPSILNDPESRRSAMRFRGVSRMLIICIAVEIFFITISSYVGGIDYIVEIGAVGLSAVSILFSLLLMRYLKSFTLPLIVANGGTVLFFVLGVLFSGGLSSPLIYLFLTIPALSISFGTRAVFVNVCVAIGLFLVAAYSAQMFGLIGTHDIDSTELTFQFLYLIGAFTLCALGGMSAQMSSLQARKSLREKNLQLEGLNQTIQDQKGALEAVSKQLAKYISPQLYQAIFSGEQKVVIDSKRKKLTIFFSDIARFTEITDRLESEELTALLNQYLTEMSKIAQEHGAYFDKFIGDAMMFYFGDPDTKGVKEDAAACVKMAIAMQRRLRQLQSGWQKQGLIDRPFEARIGINTGYCTVGNFGSEDRMDYTIIGGEVNLTARLESHADVGGILMAAETYSLVADQINAEEREAIHMKGFPEPIRTFAVTGLHDSQPYEASAEPSTEICIVNPTVNLEHLSLAERNAAIVQLQSTLAKLTT